MLGLGTGILHQAYSSEGPYQSTHFIEFDGVNERGLLEQSNDETFMDAINASVEGGAYQGGTISFWARSADIVLPNNGNLNYFMGDQLISFPNVYSFYIATLNDSGDAKIQFHRSDVNLATSVITTWQSAKCATVTLSDDTWHHFAVTLYPFSSSWRAQVYVDGVSRSLTQISATNAANTSSPTVSGLDHHIASQDGTNHNAFDIDEIGIWKSKLSADEVAYIYSQGNTTTSVDFSQDAGDYVSSSKLYSWYKMGDDKTGFTSSNQSDATGNGRDMTLVNSPSRTAH